MATKDQLLKSKKYKPNRDVLAVLLKPEKEYSLTEVDALLKEFYSRKV